MCDHHCFAELVVHRVVRQVRNISLPLFWRAAGWRHEGADLLLSFMSHDLAHGVSETYIFDQRWSRFPAKTPQLGFYFHHRFLAELVLLCKNFRLAQAIVDGALPYVVNHMQETNGSLKFFPDVECFTQGRVRFIREICRH